MALQASERHVILHQQALILTELLHCNHLHTKKENAKGAVTVLLKKVNPRKAQTNSLEQPSVARCALHFVAELVAAEQTIEIISIALGHVSLSLSLRVPVLL